MEALVHIFTKAFANPFFSLPRYRLFLSFTLFLNEDATCHIATCGCEWASNWPTTKYILVSNVIFKIIILHVINGN
jgi:hypothetical protein